MLTENDVLEILSNHLLAKGYIVNQRLNTKQVGVDLIAENNSEILYIEAKGETSSSATTKRSGKPFSPSQINDHIANAILAAFKVISKKLDDSKIQAAIALPNNEGHLKRIDRILPALNQSNIRVYLVSSNSVIEK